MKKMKEHFCLNCDLLWHDFKVDSCPECGSQDIEHDDSDVDWLDGHYEGDMPTSLTNQEVE